MLTEIKVDISDNVSMSFPSHLHLLIKRLLFHFSSLTYQHRFTNTNTHKPRFSIVSFSIPLEAIRAIELGRLFFVERFLCQFFFLCDLLWTFPVLHLVVSNFNNNSYNLVNKVSNNNNF